MTNNKGYCGICTNCVPQINGGSGFSNCEEAHAAQMAEDKAMTNNQFTDELHYGDNVLWFLSELASFEPGDIDDNDFDVYGEHESGAEGTASVGIVELAADAVKLIAKLQVELRELRRNYLALRGEIEDVRSQLYEAENQANEHASELQERRKADSDEPASFDKLNAAVAEVTGGNQHAWDANIYKGHQAVPFMNYNSLARIVDKYRAPQPAPVVPVILPCAVELKPGLIIGKGCKTETLLVALQRRADYCAEIDAMTPEESAEHDANIAAFKAMLPPSALDSKQVSELTMWVKRLAHSLRNARPGSKLHSDAMDYLCSNGLISVGDVLR
ncbi:hypothetical protein ACV8TO_06000 [Citrobacter freundii]|uniref:hypothetical protein n=1 Tax=Enterobacteriaceae TaxID=543 RepID=UPI0007A3DB30|nr:MULTISPECIES: hypothetical protein [Enterobacteriaceae]KZB43335.1 hypothetical protein AOX87_04940 [Salmonella enterica subsp. enterica serovar Schwarzengrund]KZB49942.1 hypothetical protein AOX86_00780 [Salmonella enterica subsp. enterica serovar Schwarzengrund]WEP10244.1 hypothetical protein F9155_012665 [Salmonella enterica subsp. enterica serovar 4,[5],12:i:-]